METEEIEQIFSADGQKLMLDMEIEENELLNISHNLAKAWYIDSLDIPAGLKRKYLSAQLEEIKTYSKAITKKINESLNRLNKLTAVEAVKGVKSITKKNNLNEGD